MNYSALIQNRKSVREFTDKQVSAAQLEQIREYYASDIRRLVPEIKTRLNIFGSDARAALEGAAGYNQFLIGAPQYLVLQSEKHDLAHLNAGFMMEDLVLKLQDMGLDSCWITFAASEDVKQVLLLDPDLEVAAILAFGYGKKTVKRMRLNFKSMSNVDVSAKYRYMEPKRSVFDMAFLDSWGNTRNLDQFIGFYDDMLWEALYAASLAPSYLNRQAYGFLLKDGKIFLVARPDLYNTKIDGDLSLGIVLHHFSVVSEHWSGKRVWNFEADKVDLPEGHRAVAVCVL